MLRHVRLKEMACIGCQRCLKTALATGFDWLEESECNHHAMKASTSKTNRS